MASDFQCPHCGAKVETNDRGDRVADNATDLCPQCGREYTATQAVLDYATAEKISKRSTSLIAGIAVIVALIAVFGLMLMLMPGLDHSPAAHAASRRIQCSAQTRFIGQAIAMYANENHGVYPVTLEDIIITEEMGAECFVCPSTNDTPAPRPTTNQVVKNLSAGGHLSYIYIGSGLTSSAPANTVVLYEPLSNHAGDGCNVLFADGHVEFISKQTAQTMISQLKVGQNPPPVFGAQKQF